MLRKILSIFVFLMVSFGLMGCTATPMEFSGSGITITLTDDFLEEDVIQAPFYLESRDHMFMGMRESKASLVSYYINSLSDYIDAVLEAGGLPSIDKFTQDDGDVEYMYAYYSKTVGEVDYGYMLIVMESEDYFYTMNFGCLNDKLDDNKDQYFQWLETIIVEWFGD